MQALLSISTYVSSTAALSVSRNQLRSLLIALVWSMPAALVNAAAAAAKRTDVVTGNTKNEGGFRK